MRAFDERAETSAERRAGGDGEPPPAVQRAVRQALATNHRRLEADLTTLDVLVRTGADGSSSVEEGPPQPGTVGYKEAIRFFGRVADDLRDVRAALSTIDFDPQDKQKLGSALTEAATAWDLRAKAFASTDPNTSSNLLSQVKVREQKAISYHRVLERYLPDSES